MVICLLFLMGGCSEVGLVSHVAKTVTKDPSQTTYKVGNPYQINGVWYYPEVDYTYDETGIASWYGPQFHGKPTANGEYFDMNAISAAHKTLPLPSFVKVTNLENGRSMNIRVNDRGPFVHGRIIDLSRRAAEILQFREQGIARVRVTILPEESQAVALNNQSDPQQTPAPVRLVTHHLDDLDASPSSRVNHLSPEQSLPAKEPALPASETRGEDHFDQQPVKPNFIYVQAGAFSDLDNARRLRESLASLGRTTVAPLTVRGQILHRVRVGPLPNVAAADHILETVIRYGHMDAHITLVE